MARPSHNGDCVELKRMMKGMLLHGGDRIRPHLVLSAISPIDLS